MKTKKEHFNAKEKVAFQKWVENHTWSVVCAAGLAAYKVHCIGWLRQPTKSAMEVEVDHKYLNFCLNVSESWAAPLWRKKEYEELVSVICHEVAHIITSEADDLLLYKSCQKDRTFYFERATELTSRWLLGYYKNHYMGVFKIKIEIGK